MLGATMGNIAAAYYGMPELAFIAAALPRPHLTAARWRPCVTSASRSSRRARKQRGGAGDEEPDVPRPLGYSGSSDGAAFETVEFSKKFDDPSNPQDGFAALMVCGEADAACPFVKGASMRISMPYLDPKIYDGSAFEAAKYAERRDDMGRLMLAVLMQARQRLTAGAVQAGKGN